MKALLLFTILTLGAQGVDRPCSCIPVADSAHVRAGGQEEVFVYRTDPVARILGEVHGFGGDPLEDVLVEVLQEPEGGEKVYLLSSSDLTSWLRVAACLTPKDGRFRFEGIPDGAYVVRLSKGAGWNRLHVVIDVRRSGKKQRSLTYELTPAA